MFRRLAHYSPFMHSVTTTLVRRVAAVLLGLGVVPVACAQMIPGYPDSVEAYDPREVAMLPAYCRHTQAFRAAVAGGSDPAEIAKWRGVFGEPYEHMHHYCWGLMKTNRASVLARSEQARTFYLSDSIHEFDYIIARVPKDFVLLPEMLTKKGENLIRLGQGPSGMLELEHAAQVKPDYWPAYAFMSDFYKDLGEIGKARDALERGLGAAPDSPALKRRLAELKSAKGTRR